MDEKNKNPGSQKLTKILEQMKGQKNMSFFEIMKTLKNLAQNVNLNDITKLINEQKASGASASDIVSIVQKSQNPMSTNVNATSQNDLANSPENIAASKYVEAQKKKQNTSSKNTHYSSPAIDYSGGRPFLFIPVLAAIAEAISYFGFGKHLWEFFS